MTNYESGARLERAVRDIYSTRGYYCMRSAGSKGPADLHCANEYLSVYIQCKRRGEDATEAMARMEREIRRGPSRRLEVWGPGPELLLAQDWIPEV